MNNFLKLQKKLNNNLNFFFDIKTFTKNKLSKSQEKKFANNIVYDFISLRKYKNESKFKNVKKINTKKIIYKNFIKDDNVFKNKVLKVLDKFNNIFFKKYIKEFIIHGSFATDDYIKNWSDLDTLIILKDSVMKNSKDLIKLRSKIHQIYIQILKFAPFQHHGLIMISEFDVEHYSGNFMTLEALNHNFNLYKSTKIQFKQINEDQSNNAFESLKSRLFYIKKGIKNGYYDHHVLNKKKLSIPFKTNEETLWQLFCHIAYVLNFPILFLTSINKSSHKKKSFNIFYKKIKNKNLVLFIKKHEYFRKKWNDFYDGNYYVNQKIINYFGKNYFNYSAKYLKILIKKIEEINK
jgi:hypothetical protein